MFPFFSVQTFLLGAHSLLLQECSAIDLDLPLVLKVFFIYQSTMTLFILINILYYAMYPN